SRGTRWRGPSCTASATGAGTLRPRRGTTGTDLTALVMAPGARMDPTSPTPAPRPPAPSPSFFFPPRRPRPGPDPGERGRRAVAGRLEIAALPVGLRRLPGFGFP